MLMNESGVEKDTYRSNMEVTFEKNGHEWRFHIKSKTVIKGSDKKKACMKRVKNVNEATKVRQERSK